MNHFPSLSRTLASCNISFEAHLNRGDGISAARICSGYNAAARKLASTFKLMDCAEWDTFQNELSTALRIRNVIQCVSEVSRIIPIIYRL